MTPLGLNTAAVPEAAALFPLAAAAPAAADDSAGAADSFGDLLAASFGETPVQVSGDAAPTSKGVSMADPWFATLDIDFTALNASLDAEEPPASSVTGTDQPESPVNDAAALKGAGDVSDEAAGALLMALTVPPQVPVPLSEPLPAVASAPSDTPTTSLSDLPSLSCDVSPATAQTPHSNAAQVSSDTPSDVAPLAPPPNLVKASVEDVSPDPAPVINTVHDRDTGPSKPTRVPAAAATPTAQVKAAASSLEMTVGGELPAPDDAGAVAAPVVEAPAVRPNAPRGAAVAHALEPQPEAFGSEFVASAPQAPLAEPQPQQQGPAIDVTPAMQSNGRARDAVVVRLAELAGLEQGGGSGTTAAAIAGQAGDSPSESHTQDGSAPEAFALGAQENAVATRAADGGSAAPVFTVTPPAAAAAAPAVAHAPEVSQAPPFTSVPDPQNVSRMIESMRVQIKEGIQEATVHLRPEHLGEVTISVRVERGAVSAIVHTDTPAVQQWLEAQEGKLRSGLSDQGLHLERFYVHRDGSQERREQPRQQAQTAQRYRQQRNDSSVRFEVLV